jgi:dTDP-4-dehydrorhamnose 3,5-epimerase
MNYKNLPIYGAKYIPLKRLCDSRGWFSETFRESWLTEVGITKKFIFEYWSFSVNTGTLRGLHAQTEVAPQAKLVTVINGAIQDVLVDARVNSPTYGLACDVKISCNNPGLIYIPAGCYHGFVTLEPNTYVGYKLDNYHNASSECGITYCDSTLDIPWEISDKLTVSDRDLSHPSWDTAYKFKNIL